MIKVSSKNNSRVSRKCAKVVVDADPLLKICREVRGLLDKAQTKNLSEKEYARLSELEWSLSDDHATSIAGARAQLTQALSVADLFMQDGCGGLEKFFDAGELVRFHRWEREIKLLIYSVDGFLAGLGENESPLVPDPQLNPWDFPEEVPSADELNACQKRVMACGRYSGTPIGDIAPPVQESTASDGGQSSRRNGEQALAGAFAAMDDLHLALRIRGMAIGARAIVRKLLDQNEIDAALMQEVEAVYSMVDNVVEAMGEVMNRA